jgi:Cu2+-exporting ATPase
MDHMAHKEKGHTSDPRSDQKMSDLLGSHGSLHLRVSAVGDQTALSGIKRLVAAARAPASRAQALADCAAALLFYVTVVSGGITFA